MTHVDTVAMRWRPWILEISECAKPHCPSAPGQTIASLPMSRTTAVILLVTIAALLIVGVVGFVMIGEHVIERASTAPAAASTTTSETSVAPSPDNDPITTNTWQPHPTSTLPLKVLTYPHFTIGYDEAAKNPAWVAYHLAGPILHHGHEQRPTTFATDFGTAAHVSHHDYSKSGFDRGHMCPAYALFSRYGDDGLKETFIMSNVIPQYHGLNAGEWENLESMIAGRDGHGDGWAATYGAVWVINGPVYDQRPVRERLRNGTWIPGACFSVVLRVVNGHWDALAAVMPNEKDVAGPVSRYLTTIAVIKRESQIDVLAGMDEAAKAQVEQQRATELWR